MSDPVMILDGSNPEAPPEVRPATPEEQARLDAERAAEAARISYAATRNVSTTATTTDATPVEVFRFPCEQLRLYRADLTIFGVDRGNFVSKAMEGRFTWKRTTANAVMVGITVVSDIRDAAAASWAPNAVAMGTDVVFTVAGAAGRTVDWYLTGAVDVYAPGGLD